MAGTRCESGVGETDREVALLPWEPDGDDSKDSEDELG